MFETVWSVRPVAAAIAGRPIEPAGADEVEHDDLVVVLDPSEVGAPLARSSLPECHVRHDTD